MKQTKLTELHELRTKVTKAEAEVRRLGHELKKEQQTSAVLRTERNILRRFVSERETSISAEAVQLQLLYRTTGRVD